MAHETPANWPDDLNVVEPVVHVDVGDVDGPRTDVEPTSWQVRREISTDLPERVRGAGGQSVASAEATIPASQAVTEAARNPFVATSPRVVGTDIAIRAGIIGTDGRPAQMPVFTGRVTSASSTAGDDVMDVSADDLASTLRRKVELPPIAGAVRNIYSSFESTLAVGVSGTWVMDSILRQLGYYATPPAAAPGDPAAWLDSAAVSVPFQRSLWPERGELAYCSNENGSGTPYAMPEFTTRTWPSGERFSAWTTTAEVSHAVFVQPAVGIATRNCWVSGWADGTAGEILINLQQSGFYFAELRVWVRPGEIQVQAVGNFTTVSHTFTSWPGGRFGLSCIDNGTGVDLALWWDGGSDSASLVFTSDTWGTEKIDWVRIDHLSNGMALAALQAGAPPSNLGDSFPDPWVPSADVDQTLHTLDAVPETGDATGWDILRDIAAAEVGAVWLDETGVVRFRNRHTFRGYDQTPQQITSRESLLSLGWSESVDALRSQVQVPVLPVTSSISTTGYDYVAYDASTDGTVITLPFEDGVIIPGITISLDLPDAVYGIDDTFTKGSVDPDGSYLFGNSEPDGSGTDMSPFMATWATQVSPRRVELTFARWGGGPIYLVDTNGSPAFVIRARQRITQPDEPHEFASVSTGTDGDVLTVTTSPWVQRSRDGQEIASAISADLSVPRPLLPTIEVAYDPRRQLGDVVEISDPDIMGLEPLRGVVVGVEMGGTAGDITQHLTVRLLLPTIRDMNAALDTVTIADWNTLWDGLTLADWAVDPLRVP